MKNEKEISKFVDALNSLVEDKENGTKFIYRRDKNNVDNVPFPIRKRFIIKNFSAVKQEFSKSVKEFEFTNGCFKESENWYKDSERVVIAIDAWKLWGRCGKVKLGKGSCLPFELDEIESFELDEKEKVINIRRKDCDKEYITSLEVMR